MIVTMPYDNEMTTHFGPTPKRLILFSIASPEIEMVYYSVYRVLTRKHELEQADRMYRVKVSNQF
jgi:hypothetical protein